MRNFQETFETFKRSFISAFSICMTIPLKPHDPLIMWPTCCYVIIRKSFLSTISKLMGSKPGKVLIYYGRNFSTKILKLLSTSGLVQISPSLFDLCCKNVHSKQDFGKWMYFQISLSLLELQGIRDLLLFVREIVEKSLSRLLTLLFFNNKA